MTERELPEIKIMKAHCSSFDDGFCYSANNPYYSGHYPTHGKATLAALKKKRELEENRSPKR